MMYGNGAGPASSEEFARWPKHAGLCHDGAVLRIHFTFADVTKVRVVVLGPLAELQTSLTKLHEPGNRALFDGWRTRTAAGSQVLSPDVREVARFIAPPTLALVDLFTLVGPADDWADGVDRLCRVPAGPLRDEFALTAGVGIRPGWIGDFTDGDRTAQRRLTSALAEYHTLAIAPYWPRIRAVLDNERTARVEIMASHGLDAMLAGLAPALRWKPPVLEVPGHRGAPAHLPANHTDTDFYLQGRGLLLAPSVFNIADPGLYLPWNNDPAVLIYPIDLDAPTALRLWRRPGETNERALAGLLGTTRATALKVIADGCTTTELAQRLGISPGGASQHATVLREAGLVVSRRHRNTVRHALTSLGVDLLNAA